VEDRVDRILVQRHPQTLKYLAGTDLQIFYNYLFENQCDNTTRGDHARMSRCSAILISDLADFKWDVDMVSGSYRICGSYFADGL
jgi:hypothetical protein